MTWQPLLTDESRSVALGVVRDVVAVLADPPSSWVPPGAAEQYVRIANATLGGGRAGIALLFGYLARIDPADDAFRAAARSLIVDSAGVAQSEVLGPSLFSGFPGVGWALGKLSAWDVVA